MRDLNAKLDKVYKFTVDFIEENGFSPSVREICEKCDIKSTATAYSYLERLKEKGVLCAPPMKKRALSITSDKIAYKKIPLIGTVAAGQPIFAVENLDGYIPLPNGFSSCENGFALKVKGDSMINADIFDKDTILVRMQDTAENGEIVVALVDDSATVKRFYKRNGKIILHPENDEMEDMIFDDVKILGVVKGLMRNL